MQLHLSVILSCFVSATTAFLVQNPLSHPGRSDVNILFRSKHVQSSAAGHSTVSMCSHGVRHGKPRVGSHQYIQSLRSRRLSRGERANHHLELSHRETSAVVRHEEHQVGVGEAAEQHKVMHKVGGRIGSIQLAGLQPIPNNEERQAAVDVLLYSEDEVSEGMVHLLEFDRDEDTIIDFQQLSALHGSIWNGENKETLLGSRRLKATADILKDFNAEESQQHLKILGSRRLGAIYQVAQSLYSSSSSSSSAS